MKKIVSLATVATFLLSGAAHAVTLDITLGLTPGSVSYSTGTTFVQNVDLSNPGLNSLALGVNSVLLPNGAENDNYFKPPSGVTGEYLAVTENLTFPHTGSAVFTLAPSSNQFGFTWGTIDSYNTLTLTDSRNDQYVIVGNDISNNPPLSASILSALYPGGFGEGASQAKVEITDPYGNIVSAQFQSSTNSFEAGGFYVGDPPSATPLPPALPLFAAGMLGLAGFGYWRRRTAAKT